MASRFQNIPWIQETSRTDIKRDLFATIKTWKNKKKTAALITPIPLAQPATTTIRRTIIFIIRKAHSHLS